MFTDEGIIYWLVSGLIGFEASYVLNEYYGIFDLTGQFIILAVPITIVLNIILWIVYFIHIKKIEDLYNQFVTYKETKEGKLQQIIHKEKDTIGLPILFYCICIYLLIISTLIILPIIYLPSYNFVFLAVNLIAPILFIFGHINFYIGIISAKSKKRGL